ncbi:MAG: hypothetical protein AB7I59_31050 [Geminicoccaceae bacterium]
MTKLQFTDRFVERFSLYFPESEFFVPRELEIHWRSPGQETFEQTLENFWPEIREVPPELQLEIVDVMVDYVIEHSYPERLRPASKPSTRFGIEQVLPVIRPKNHGMTAVGLIKGMPHRPFVGDLVVHYVFDQPGSMASLLNAQLEELGVDEATLWNAAIENRRRINQKVEYTAKGFGIVMQGTDYESSMILDDEFWSGVEGMHGGEHIAIIPCSNTLLFARPDSEEVGELLRLAAQLFLEQKIPISKDPLVRRNGVWQLWPVPDHLKPDIAIN